MEKRKLGWGKQTARAGADSMGDFDACCICLHQAKDPLLCPRGYLYCKGCIYEFLLTKKQQIKKQNELYKKQQQEQADESADKGHAAKLKEIEEFAALENSVITSKAKKRKTNDPVGYESYSTPSGDVFIVDKDTVHKHFEDAEKTDRQRSEADRQERKAMLPCYWIPSLTPNVGKTILSKPDKKVRGPYGHQLKLKMLKKVVWTPHKGNTKSKKGNQDLFMCPICFKSFTNSSKCFLVTTTCSVLSEECVKLVLQDGAHNGEPVSKSDVIQLQRGGTGFAAGGAQQVTTADSRQPKPVGPFW